MNPDRRTFLSLGVGALAVAAVPAALRRLSPLVRRRIPIMGTVAEIVVPSRDPHRAHAAIDEGFAALREVERTMSRFRADSDVGRLNAAGGAWVDVAPETAHVLDSGLRWARISGGRFDPCLGRVTAVWDGTEAGCAVEELDPRLVGGQPVDGGERAGGAPSLEVRSEGRGARARLVRAEAAVDLGGIAKGYGVDRAADALRAAGVVDGLVNVGGDLVALGRAPDGAPWLVGVQAPDDPRRLATTLEVEDGAIATSGDYVRWFEHDGRRFHHLIDPATGAPRRTPMRSLTVGAERCADADAAATALFGAPGHIRTRIASRAPGVRVLHLIQEETA